MIARVRSWRSSLGARPGCPLPLEALIYHAPACPARGPFFKWCRFPSNRGVTVAVAGYAGTLAIVTGVDDD